MQTCQNADSAKQDDDLQQPVRFLHLAVQLRNLLLQCANLPKQGRQVSKGDSKEEDHIEHSMVHDVGNGSR